MSQTSVVKLGSSLLRSEADLSLAVHAIYREWRAGRRVVAAVSALGSTTDELLQRAEQLGLPPEREAAALLTRGEANPAALLALALDRSGIPATLLDLSPAHQLDPGDPFAVNGVVVVPAAGTRHETEAPASAVPFPRPPLRVALLGCGTVGGGVLAHLLARPSLFEVTGVAVRDLDRVRVPPVPRPLLTDDPAALVERGADVVVELLGGLEPARRLIVRALGLRCHVVTANKALLAMDVEPLAALASLRGVSLRFSASVGGALPALEAVRRAAASGRVRLLAGVLNGTCNFVLDRCAAGASFSAAVEEAREAGYAEADPSLDLDGSDTAQKLSLLAREAFGEPVPWDGIARRGIYGLDAAVAAAARRGRVMRLVASCERSPSGLRARVEPLELPPDHPFARTAGAGNALGIELEGGELRSLSARGAGRWPTSEAVLADLTDLALDCARAGRDAFVGEEGAA